MGKKCSGKATGVEVEDGMYVMDLIIRKGKVTIAKCDKEEGPAPTGPGTGGSGNGGEGSGSGNGGEGTGPQDVLVYQREWEEQDLHLLLGAVQDLGQPRQQGA